MATTNKLQTETAKLEIVQNEDDQTDQLISKSLLFFYQSNKIRFIRVERGKLVITRDIAQLGRAPALGAGCRRFKSYYPELFEIKKYLIISYLDRRHQET